MVHKNKISSPCTFWRMLLVISQYKAMYLYKTMILAKACLLPQMRYHSLPVQIPQTSLYVQLQNSYPLTAFISAANILSLLAVHEWT